MTEPAPTPAKPEPLTIAERDEIHKRKNALGLRTGKVRRPGTWHLGR